MSQYQHAPFAWRIITGWAGKPKVDMLEASCGTRHCHNSPARAAQTRLLCAQGNDGEPTLLFERENRYAARALIPKSPAMPTKPRPTPKNKSARSASRTRVRPQNLLYQMGLLRVALIALVILDMLAAPAPGAPAIYSGWELVSTLILPVLAPILLQVLLLDALMGRIMMGSAKGAERARYRRIVTVNLVFSIALVLWWVPYFLKLFAR
jgi:hypothetical protein